MGARRGTVRSALTCVLLALALVAPLIASTARTPPASAALRPCSNGLVALTFDDGPSLEVTGKLLDVLTDRQVPATFFWVGERVASAKGVALTAYRRGFVIGNHTYGHESLPSLSDDAIRSTLRRTADVLRSAGVRPSTLMRPPYGAIDARVSSVVRGMGLTPVLWDIDTRNWEPSSPADLTARVLSGLRPHGRNVVLLHDGVARSTTTLAAVPAIIREVRARGYCFAELGASGLPVPPVPALRISDAKVEEADPGDRVRLTFTLRLDRPTSRPVSVRATTSGLRATEGTDFRETAGRVELPAGTTTGRVTVRVRGDRLDERRERLRLRLDRPRGLTIADRTGLGTIADDDPRPRVTMSDAAVTEPGQGSASVRVPIALDRPRDRKVVLRIGTRPVEADDTDYVPFEHEVVVRPGDVRARVFVEVLADAVEEPSETLEVRVLDATGARLGDATATVTIDAPVPVTPGAPLPE